MKILFVLHADFEQPGAIASWAASHQFETNYCRPFAGEAVPSMDAYDWLVVMGGPQSPSQLDRYPYLQLEIDLIQAALSSDKIVLGFCLGAQLLGEALGAPTERSPHKEVGVFPIQLTKEGRSDAILGALPDKFDVVHWHNDMPGLTADGVVLAVSEGCPRQVIRYTDRAYGFQCHPEPSLEDIKGMVAHCEDDLTPGLYIQSKEELLSADYKSINRTMYRILDDLLSHI